MNKELLVKDQTNFQAIGEEISHELAAKMVKNHHDKHSLDKSCSYVIGKKIMEEILSQPGCIGLRFFDAYNESGEKTLVYVGIDAMGKSILEVTTVNSDGKIAVIKSIVGDQLLAPKPFHWSDI
jgi:hypothetical protein